MQDLSAYGAAAATLIQASGSEGMLLQCELFSNGIRPEVCGARPRCLASFRLIAVVGAAPEIALPNLLRDPLHKGLVHLVDLRRDGSTVDCKLSNSNRSVRQAWGRSDSDDGRPCKCLQHQLPPAILRTLFRCSRSRCSSSSSSGSYADRRPVSKVCTLSITSV